MASKSDRRLSSKSIFCPISTLEAKKVFSVGFEEREPRFLGLEKIDIGVKKLKHREPFSDRARRKINRSQRVPGRTWLEEDVVLNAIMARQGSTSPLARYPLFASSDLDEVRERVADIFCPHDLRIIGRNHRIGASMHHAPIGGISLNRLRYGATVAIDPGCLKDFLLVMMPLSGSAEVRCGDQRIHSTPRLASVVTPTQSMRETNYADSDQIMVRIDRSLLERVCAQHLGHELRRPIEFQLGMNLTAKASASWLALIAYLLSELDREDTPLRSTLAQAQIEHFVVTTLLLMQPHTFRTELLQPAPPLAPRYVKRVEEYIEQNADQPLTVSALAAYAGVSTSALYAGFRNFRNTSPMVYLKSVRLQRVHEDLGRASAGSDTVTKIAMRWGFVHLGHFTANYKRKFGEFPSETLARSN